MRIDLGLRGGSLLDRMSRAPEVFDQPGGNAIGEAACLPGDVDEMQLFKPGMDGSF